MDMKKKQKRCGDEDVSLLLLLHKFGSFIVHVTRFYKGKDALLMLSSPYDDEPDMSGGGGSGDDQVEVEVDDLGFDIYIYMKTIVGSCNGLVCVQDRQLTSHSQSEPLVVSLWNPVVRQGINLPESIPIPGGIFSLFVFGFDVETKDYKVVQFTSLKPRRNNENELESCFCGVQVYSLSTNSWRLLEGIPCLPGYPFRYADSVVYLNGTCFFLAHFFYRRGYPCLDLNDRFIISFDFTKEIITPIQLPDHDRDQDLCLCSLGDDKIALFASTKPDLFEYGARISNCQDFSIWVLNYERGSSVNKDSWKQLYSFQIQLESRDKWFVPSGISNDGKFALLQSGHCSKMNLYNFATKEVKSNFLSCCQVMSKAHAYKPSLVSDIGGDGAGWRKLSFRHRWKWCRVEEDRVKTVKWCRVEEEEEQQQDRVIENSATNL